MSSTRFAVFFISGAIQGLQISRDVTSSNPPNATTSTSVTMSCDFKRGKKPEHAGRTPESLADVLIPSASDCSSTTAATSWMHFAVFNKVVRSKEPVTFDMTLHVRDAASKTLIHSSEVGSVDLAAACGCGSAASVAKGSVEREVTLTFPTAGGKSSSSVRGTVKLFIVYATTGERGAGAGELATALQEHVALVKNVFKSVPPELADWVATIEHKDVERLIDTHGSRLRIILLPLLSQVRSAVCSHLFLSNADESLSSTAARTSTSSVLHEQTRSLLDLCGARELITQRQPASRAAFTFVEGASCPGNAATSMIISSSSAISDGIETVLRPVLEILPFAKNLISLCSAVAKMYKGRKLLAALCSALENRATLLLGAVEEVTEARLAAMAPSSRLSVVSALQNVKDAIESATLFISELQAANMVEQLILAVTAPERFKAHHERMLSELNALHNILGLQRAQDTTSPSDLEAMLASHRDFEKNQFDEVLAILRSSHCQKGGSAVGATSDELSQQFISFLLERITKGSTASLSSPTDEKKFASDELRLMLKCLYVSAVPSCFVPQTLRLAANDELLDPSCIVEVLQKGNAAHVAALIESPMGSGKSCLLRWLAARQDAMPAIFVELKDLAQRARSHNSSELSRDLLFESSLRGFDSSIRSRVAKYNGPILWLLDGLDEAMAFANPTFNAILAQFCGHDFGAAVTNIRNNDLAVITSREERTSELVILSIRRPLFVWRFCVRFRLCKWGPPEAAAFFRNAKSSGMITTAAETALLDTVCKPSVMSTLACTPLTCQVACDVGNLAIFSGPHDLIRAILENTFLLAQEDGLLASTQTLDSILLDIAENVLQQTVQQSDFYLRVLRLSRAHEIFFHYAVAYSAFKRLGKVMTSSASLSTVKLGVKKELERIAPFRIDEVAQSSSRLLLLAHMLRSDPSKVVVFAKTIAELFCSLSKSEAKSLPSRTQAGADTETARTAAKRFGLSICCELAATLTPHANVIDVMRDLHWVIINSPTTFRIMLHEAASLGDGTVFERLLSIVEKDGLRSEIICEQEALTLFYDVCAAGGRDGMDHAVELLRKRSPAARKSILWEIKRSDTRRIREYVGELRSQSDLLCDGDAVIAFENLLVSPDDSLFQIAVDLIARCDPLRVALCAKRTFTLMKNPERRLRVCSSVMAELHRVINELCWVDEAMKLLMELTGMLPPAHSIRIRDLPLCGERHLANETLATLVKFLPRITNLRTLQISLDFPFNGLCKFPDGENGWNAFWRCLETMEKLEEITLLEGWEITSQSNLNDISPQLISRLRCLTITSQRLPRAAAAAFHRRVCAEGSAILVVATDLSTAVSVCPRGCKLDPEVKSGPECDLKNIPAAKEKKTSVPPPVISAAGGGTGLELLHKVLVIGEGGCGKTCFIRRYVHGIFQATNKPTIGVDFALKMLNHSGRSITLQIWDIAGQERYGQMTRVYYQTSVGAIVLCDITRPETMDLAIKWKEDLDTKVFLGTSGKPIPCILAVNKADLGQLHKSREEMDVYCRDYGFVGWFETSAKDDKNISHVMNALVDHVVAITGDSAQSLPAQQDKRRRKTSECSLC